MIAKDQSFPHLWPLMLISAEFIYIHLCFAHPPLKKICIVVDMVPFLLFWFLLQRNCTHPRGELCIGVCLSQLIQDELLREEIETIRASESGRTHIPLHRFQNYATQWNQEAASGNKNSCLSIGSTSCMREMYHYARVSGSHIFECVIDAALGAIRTEQLQKASNVRFFYHAIN